MKFAVIKTGGKQYEVKEGQSLKVEKLPKTADDKKVAFEEVLLVADGERVTVGAPTVAGAKVEGTLIKDSRRPKVTIIRFKSKTGYSKVKGHKQPYSEVKIEKIS